jgi:hypothetical protein
MGKHLPTACPGGLNPSGLRNLDVVHKERSDRGARILDSARGNAARSEREVARLSLFDPTQIPRESEEVFSAYGENA